MSAETCPKEVWTGWSERTCGKPVKRRGLCGVHAAAIERSERIAGEKRTALEERTAKSAALVERLSVHGIDAQVGYDGRLMLPSAAAIVDALDAKYGKQQ